MRVRHTRSLSKRNYNMEWRGLLQIKETALLLSPSLQPTPYLNSHPQSDLESDVFKLSNKVSPSVLLIIIILAIIFFVSGLLHLLVRFLVRPTSYRDPDDLDINVTALQGQLQQLFHLHDAGVDQTYIDTLPVFLYKAIIGLKKNCPFDCAVCLCEFESEDKLRLLPKCSHAFHTDCIDTWLLSHSTCPLCRTSLFPPENRAPSSPILLLLESGTDPSREINDIGRTNSVLTSNSCASFRTENNGLGSLRFDLVSTKPCEIILDNNNNNNSDDVAIPAATEPGSAEQVVTVKLGKFRSVVAADDIGEGISSSNNHDNNSSTIDARRCYSMGSFEYIMDENSSLQVPIRTPMKKQSSKKPSLPLTPGHRTAMSECDCESGRDFVGLDAVKSSLVSSRIENNVSNKSKRESFSISKIWARKDKERIPTEKVGSTSRRAFSFRSAISRSGVAAADDSDNMKQKNIGGSAWRTNSEMGVGRWEENGGSNEFRYCCDVENQREGSSGSDGSNINRHLESEQKTPSFARKTLQWLVSRQSKVVHSSLPPTV